MRSGEHTGISASARLAGAESPIQMLDRLQFPESIISEYMKTTISRQARDAPERKTLKEHDRFAHRDYTYTLQPADTIQLGDKALGPEDLQLVAAENAFLEPRCYVKHTIV